MGQGFELLTDHANELEYMINDIQDKLIKMSMDAIGDVQVIDMLTGLVDNEYMRDIKEELFIVVHNIARQVGVKVNHWMPQDITELFV